MKANELRIGNYVFSGVVGNVRVDEIRLVVGVGYVVRMYLRKWEDYESWWDLKVSDAKPITLTPELLEKCGFKNNVDKYYLDEKDITCICRGDGLDIAEKGGRYYLWEECQDPWYSGCRIEVKSLHGLQNLYYALTGEELTITWN